MVFLLDTSSPVSFLLSLCGEAGQAVRTRTVKSGFQQSEKLLSAIDRFLLDSQTVLTRLAGIIVVTGPGGFTSLRTGIATANAIGYACGIPVQGVKKPAGRTISEIVAFGLRQIRNTSGFSQAVPAYGSPPHITTSQKVR